MAEVQVAPEVLAIIEIRALEVQAPEIQVAGKVQERKAIIPKELHLLTIVKKVKCFMKLV